MERWRDVSGIVKVVSNDLRSGCKRCGGGLTCDLRNAAAGRRRLLLSRSGPVKLVGLVPRLMIGRRRSGPDAQLLSHTPHRADPRVKSISSGEAASRLRFPALAARPMGGAFQRLARHRDFR
jgi:hypothetical protein